MVRRDARIEIVCASQLKNTIKNKMIPTIYTRQLNRPKILIPPPPNVSLPPGWILVPVFQLPIHHHTFPPPLPPRRRRWFPPRKRRSLPPLPPPPPPLVNSPSPISTVSTITLRSVSPTNSLHEYDLMPGCDVGNLDDFEEEEEEDYDAMTHTVAMSCVNFVI